MTRPVLRLKAIPSTPQSPAPAVEHTASIEAVSSFVPPVPRAERVARLLAELRRRYPTAFSTRPRPLKVGIHHDLEAQLPVLGTSRRDLIRAMRRYTSSAAYHRSLTAGAPRRDLAGNPCGNVTSHQAAIAADTT